MKMKFTIVFDGWEWEGSEDGIEMNLSGYNCWDYLPGGYHAEFVLREDAEAYIVENHRGMDIDGISAIFSIQVVSQ